MINWDKLAVGDWVKVEYEIRCKTGERFGGGTVSGQITEFFWDEDKGIFQALVEGGGCFHSHDTLLEHVRRER